jgi:hypothetical protein
MRTVYTNGINNSFLYICNDQLEYTVFSFITENILNI